MKDNFNIDEITPIFSRATQTMFALIDKSFQEYALPECDLSDLFYFGCVFLGILATRLNSAQQEGFVNNLSEILTEAAHDGMIMCKDLLSTNLNDSAEQNKAAKELITKLNGEEQLADNNLVLSLSKDLHQLSTKESGIWKGKDNFQYHNELEKLVVVRFNELINHVLDNVSELKPEIRSNPELFFITTAIINVGLMAGYGSILYRQSLDEFLKKGIEKINSILKNQPKTKVTLH